MQLPMVPLRVQAACKAGSHGIRHRRRGGHVQAAPLPAHRYDRQHLRLLPRRPRLGLRVQHTGVMRPERANSFGIYAGC